MKVLAVIAEYNPFHNGHLYQLEESLRKSKADYTVCVMSGHFLQRGEPALVDKWARAKMALAAGIDLVIELPFAYAVRSAQDFAFGAVSILESTGIINYLSFGSELGELTLLRKLARVLLKEPEDLGILIKKELDKGLSYPKAQAQALEIYSPEFTADLWQPNNILALEYLKSLEELQSKMQPLTIKRKKTNYHDLEIVDNFASASGIREIIRQGKTSSAQSVLNAISPSIPLSTLEILAEEFDSGRGPVFAEDFSHVLLSSLRKASPQDLIRYLDVIEGLEQRIKKKASIVGTLEELIEQIKTRRYTKTRIQRVLIHHLLNFTKDTASLFKERGGPQYLRILGASSRGTLLIKEMKRKAKLPLIQKINLSKKEKSSFSAVLESMLNLDILASDLYCLAYKNPQYRIGGKDFYFSLFSDMS